MIQKIIIFVPILLLSIVSFVSAHVKWFVDTEKVIGESHNQTPFYYLSSKEVIIWAIISIIVVLVFSILDRIIREPKKLLSFGEKYEVIIDRVAQGVLGLFLVTVGVIWKVVLIPEFPVTDSLSALLASIEIALGVMFVIGMYPRMASCALIILYTTLLFKVGPEAFFENIMLLTLAFYFLIKHSPKGACLNKLNKHAVEIVRIGTGISLIIMAFSEKLSYPELGLSFLDVHNWNFMYNFGLTWFTNNLFVLSTGFAEMIFGVIFILGYLTRINTVLIASFFAASVITMAVQFGQWEVEDLVVYSAAILFIFYGHGKTKFFHFILPESFLHTRTIRRLFRK